MGGITSGIGIFSGIDTRSLIDQLLAVEGRPKLFAQRRLVQLQAQQTAFLDINTRLGALKTAAAKFNTLDIFRAAGATSSNPDVLTATASAGATQGSFSFTVDRLVSTQQLLSRGFSDRDTTSVGPGSFTFEPDAARLDTDTQLSELNGGAGITRGRIRITDASNATALVDLSRVETVNDVLEAINGAEGVRVSARVEGGRFVIEDETTGPGNTGTLRVENDTGSTTAASLGIAAVSSVSGDSGWIDGGEVHRLGGHTTLRSLNDGNGVRVNTAGGVGGTHDFRITTRDGATHDIDIGDIWEIVDGDLTRTSAAVSTVQGVIDRINTAADGAVTASVNDDGSGLKLVDNTGGAGALSVSSLAGSGAAADLGIEQSAGAGTITGSRVVAGLNTTLVRNLMGGAGLADGAFTITDRTGAFHNFTVGTGGSVADILADIESGTGGAIVARLDENGTGLILTDTTGGAGNLSVGGAGAASLGFLTPLGGVAASTLDGSRVQRRYVAESTLLETLNGGRGIGTGSFEVFDSTGRRGVVNISASARTIGDAITQINGQNSSVRARINDNGDGIILEDPTGGGTLRISVRDTSGAVAEGLNIAGEAAGSGPQNVLDGSFEREITFDAGDTLDDVVRTINEAGAGVTVGVINDGSGATPFRLSFTSDRTGRAGRFILDTNGFDLGVRTLSGGQNARLFYGSDDPASAVLLSSDSNVFDGVIAGVSIDARAASDDPVTLSVTRDTAAIETAVTEFVEAYNDVVGRIDTLSDYDEQTERRGTLLGDSLVLQLRASLYDTVQGRGLNVSGRFQFLSQVGVGVGAGGDLELDAEALRSALEQDPAAVAELFAARVAEPREPIEISPGITAVNTDPETFSSLGVAERIARLVAGYTDTAGGILTERNSTLGDQIRLQNQRIAAFDAKLESRRGILQSQFLAMERAIAQLQSQQASLGNLRGF